MVQKIQNTALFIGNNALVRDLPEGNIGQPAVPVPEAVAVAAARNNKFIFQDAIRLPEHFTVIVFCVLGN